MERNFTAEDADDRLKTGVKQPLVYILILNWCSQEDVLCCVKAIQKLEYRNYKIILIDNASPDQSGERLRRQFPEYVYLQTAKNLGYAGGNNIGIRYAIQAGADYIWIINPDVRVEANSLKVMIKAMEEDVRLGICGPVIKEYDKTETAPEKIYGWKIYSEKGWMVEKIVTCDRKNSTDYIYGCSFLIKRNLLLDIGLFREEFFTYFEEVELCLRAKRKNWRLSVLNAAENSHFLKKNNPKKFFYVNRNMILIARIEKRFIIRALLNCLNGPLFFKQLSQGKAKEAFFAFKKNVSINFTAAFSGLFTVIKNPVFIDSSGSFSRKAVL